MDLLKEFLYVVWLENPKGGGERDFWRNPIVKTISKSRIAQLSQRKRWQKPNEIIFIKISKPSSQSGVGGKNKNKKK